MSVYFMFGKYAPEGLKQISKQRTKRATAIIQKYGGEILGMYALLGDNDLIFIVQLPSTDVAILASMALSEITGISFKSSPAITVGHFDTIASKKRG